MKMEDAMNRKCYICKEEKSFEEFHKDKTQVGGISYDCKKCKSETRKRKRAENPEKYREQLRKSFEKNRESIRASQKRHKELNKDRINARRRELREPKKKEINEKEKERRKNDKNFFLKERIRQKRWREHRKEENKPKFNAHKMVMYAIKLGVVKRPNQCSECGIECKPEGHHEDYSRPLDVIWLCKVCHKGKHKKYELPKQCEYISSGNDSDI